MGIVLQLAALSMQIRLRLWRGRSHLVNEVFFAAENVGFDVHSGRTNTCQSAIAASAACRAVYDAPDVVNS